MPENVVDSLQSPTSSRRQVTLQSSHPKVAIVGTGMIARTHRRAALLAGAKIVGVLGSSAERTAKFAADWRVGEYANMEEIAHSNADVVHICTPNHLHAEYAAAALNAGKHVVLEKPVATSLGEAEELAALAETTGLTVTVPFVYRYHPVIREIRARRLSGDLGDVHLVHGSYLQDWLLAADASNWRVDPTLGGKSRAFADIGSHWCDLAEWTSGRTFSSLVSSTSITVSARPADSKESFAHTYDANIPKSSVETEDSAAVLMRDDDGAMATTTVSQLAAGRKNRLWLEIDGTKGSAAFDQENSERAWFGRAEGAEVFFRDSSTGSDDQRRLSMLPAGHAQGYETCFELFLRDSYELMSGEAVEGVPTIHDGLRSARIVDAMLRSAAAHAWVSI